MDSSESPAGGFIVLCAFVLVYGILFGFSAAIQALNDKDLETREAQGDKRAMYLSKMKSSPELLFNTIQCAGTFICLFMGSYVWYYGTDAWRRLIDLTKITGLLSEGLISALSGILSLVSMLFITCFLGFLLPKKLGACYSNAWAFGLVKPVRIVLAIFYPVTYLISILVNAVLGLFGINAKMLQEDVTEEEIMSMVDEGHEQGVLEASEAEMIHNIFEMGDKEAQDIMIHRKNIIAVNGEKSLKENLDFMLESVSSRFPVYVDNIDNIIGILHLKDAMRCHTRKNYDQWLIKDIPDLIRPAVFIPETRNIAQLFQSMQTRKLQMVMVADEYGQTAGLIAQEDILEEIVGNLMDEYDVDEKFIEEMPDGSYLMDGMTPLREVEEVLHIELQAENYETLNGYMVYRLFRIPEEGESSQVRTGEYIFKIISVANKTIQKVEVSRCLEEIQEEK